jgi:hypothetical protein
MVAGSDERSGVIGQPFGRMGIARMVEIFAVGAAM